MHTLDEGRRVAAYVEWQKQGAWVILWGPYTRCFWAFACWPVVPREGVVIRAEDPDALYSEMRYVERMHGYLWWRYGRGRTRVPSPRPPA
ncbi:hypothetical protein [Nocardiopsis xinjiangensis]|uniref:hypothetical protein n=1 Tax=Nocardiopsis xinjiangensis TaxID=124285 RepID=UPI00034B8F80|nr:hypothetical protein [Nocardiopsis xinjiangensis]